MEKEVKDPQELGNKEQKPAEEQAAQAPTSSEAEESNKTECNKEEKPAPKSGRELIFGRMKEFDPEFPDDADDEALFGKIGERFDDYEGRIKGLSADKAKMEKLVERDPAAAMALDKILNGEPMPVALRAAYSDEELSMQEGDENYEAYKKAGQEYEQRKADKKKKDEEDAQRQKDIDSLTDSDLEAYAKENGLSDEEANKFAEDVMGLLQKMANNGIDKDTWGRFYKMMHHDQDVEDAQNAGRVAGRNEQIAEEFRKPKGDGLPETGAHGGAGGEKEEKPENSDESRMAKLVSGIASRSIWDKAK